MNSNCETNVDDPIDMKQCGSNILDNITFSIDLDSMSQSSEHKRNVKIIHCGDGIVEECEEEERERERLEEEEKQKEIERRRQLDIEAVGFIQN